MPVLVETDAAWASALAPGLPSGTQVVGGIPQLDNWLANQSEEYAVVLGPNVALDEAIALAERLRQHHPTTGMVLLRHELTSDVFQVAMRAGIPAVVAANDVE
jgi:pilus assembly protein CpaE